MRTMTDDQFDSEVVVNELLDGAGAIRLAGLFDQSQVRRAREAIETDTDDAAFTGSHFNQGVPRPGCR